MAVRLRLLALAVFGLVALAGTASAQVPGLGVGVPGSDGDAAETDPRAPDSVDAVLSGLTDEQVRRLLAETLRREAAAAETSDAGSVDIDDVMAGYNAQIDANLELVADALPRIPGELHAAWTREFAARPGEAISPLLAFGLVVAAGALAVAAVSAASRPLRRKAAAGGGAGVWPVFWVRIVEAAAFAGGAATMTALLLVPDDPMHAVAAAVVFAGALLFGVRALSWLLLGPSAPAYARLAVRGAAAGILLFGLAQVAADLHTDLGLSEESRRVLLAGAALIAAIVAAVTVFRLTRHPGYDRWMLLLMPAVIVFWFVWTMNLLAFDDAAVRALSFGAAIVVAIPFIDVMVPKVLARRITKARRAADKEVSAFEQGFATDGEDLPPEEPAAAPHSAALSFEEECRIAEGPMRRAVRAVLLGAAALLAPVVGGYDLAANLATPLGDAAFTAGITVVVAYVGWQLIRVFTDKFVQAEDAGAADEGEHKPRSRAETLLPLFRSALGIILTVLTAMIVLSAIGVNIAPLLAGAGVVGLAIGFGAQALVKDIVSGIFFLIDDSFRVGEYIEIEELRGTVETISIRSMKLRHHRGILQTIPFGEVRSVRNHSRDWVIYKMEFRLPFETDVEKVRKLIKKIGQELMSHPDIGADFLEPLKSQGVNRMEETAQIIRCKFMCRPQRQFMIRREAYRRIADAFRENGIQLAPRGVYVHTGGPKAPAEEGAPPAAAAAVAGAAAAAAVMAAEEADGPDGGDDAR